MNDLPVIESPERPERPDLILSAYQLEQIEEIADKQEALKQLWSLIPYTSGLIENQTTEEEKRTCYERLQEEADPTEQSLMDDAYYMYGYPWKSDIRSVDVGHRWITVLMVLAKKFEMTSDEVKSLYADDYVVLSRLWWYTEIDKDVIVTKARAQRDRDDAESGIPRRPLPKTPKPLVILGLPKSAEPPKTPPKRLGPKEEPDWI
jgi:hypothetical protein